MELKKDKSYFVSKPAVVLRASPDGKAVNQLLFGDWLRWLGESRDGWEKIHCRNDDGWIRHAELSEQRALEINFVDIGQGDSVHMVTPDDEIVLIDAGKTNNLFRFIHWRYNLRDRKVKEVDGVSPTDPDALGPLVIENVMISHPDKDHYFGFRELFEHPKLTVTQVFHNGLVERPISQAEKDAVKTEDNIKHFSNDDLGRYVNVDGSHYVWDVVHTDSEMRELIDEHRNTRKLYLGTLVKATENPANHQLKFQSLTKDDRFFPGHDENDQVTIEVLGPVTESVTFEAETRRSLRRLGGEDVTKNGHSVVLQLRIGHLRVMLGGDLNTEAEDFLLKHYCETDEDASELETLAYHLNAKGPTLSGEEHQQLAEAQTTLAAIVTKAGRHFEVDVTKACHHGSHHFSETFLKALNAIAVVISSGDAESYSHPRPDALGAFGKYGRGNRPLIFSTEIARSTREFTPIKQYFDKLQAFQAALDAAQSNQERRRIEKEMESAKDSNVARYGMITLRTDGETVIIAQKLEVAAGDGQKWDIHQLVFNEAKGILEYRDKTKEH